MAAKMLAPTPVVVGQPPPLSTESELNQQITKIGRMYSSEGIKIIKLFTKFY